MVSVTRNTYCSWVKNALKALGRGSPHEVYRWIKLHEGVPAAELVELTPRGESRFEHRVRWARFSLFKAGTVSNREGHGVWVLTP